MVFMASEIGSYKTDQCLFPHSDRKSHCGVNEQHSDSEQD